MSDTLWCVHIIGPDDLLACASRKDAVQNALWLNLSGYGQQNTNDELMPVAWAIPEPWPGTAEAHHEALGDQECQDERWTDAEVKVRLLAGEVFDFTEDGRPIDWDAMVDDAEQRGAVKALREADAALLDLRDSLRHKRERHSWPMGVEDAARKVRSLADAAEVTP
jgi:hypothetical protein